MLLCLIPTAIGLKLQAPIYKVEALLDKTSAYDIQALQPSKLLDGEDYQVPALEKEAFYAALITQAGSLNTRRLFWESWSKQPLSTDPNASKSPNDIAFKKFIRSFSLTPPNPKNPATTLSQLTLETSDPSAGVDVLSAYLDFVNTRVVEQFVAQLEKGYASSLQRLAIDYAALQEREQQQLQDDLIKLNEALGLARSLKIIETPYEQLSGIELKVVDDRHYLLGTRVLTEEIKSLEERSNKPLSAFVPQLRNMEHWQQVMQNEMIKLTSVKNQIQAFELASPAVSSLDPIKPKKLLIFIAALFVSGILGVTLVLIRQGIKSYRARAEPLPEQAT
jgi:chain length determinant protein (polysaccharide antigen chain regulator)